jgi:hypothetical protein
MPQLSRSDTASLEKFIAPYKRNPSVIGIILTGSVVHSRRDKNTDFDVHIVIDRSDWRERGNVWINNVEIEYFINPVRQIRRYFKNQRAGASAHMFAHSVILYKKGGILEKLIAEAREVLQNMPAPITKVQRELARYGLDDQRKDLEDVYLRRDWFAFERISASTLDSCLDAFEKVKRLRGEKSKRLEQYLYRADPAFAKMFVQATLERDYDKRLHAVYKIVAYTEKLLGGGRPKNWKLRGPLANE